MTTLARTLLRRLSRTARAMLDLADVRDAVMHNQLIDDNALIRLTDLQAALYRALNKRM